MVTNLTKKQLEKVQIDESLIFLNYGEDNQQFLAPTRGGGEFVATATVRPIEFDGRRGKTAGTEVIEEQAASIKVTTLCMSQENLALTIPNCKVGNDEGKTIENPESGLVADSSYLKNVTMFAKLLGGSYKKITIYNPLHESGLTSKAVQKAEGELAFELHAHYPCSDLNGKGKLWKIEDITEAPKTDVTTGTQTTNNETTEEPVESTSGDEPETTEE